VRLRGLAVRTALAGLGVVLALGAGELALRAVAAVSPGVRYLATAGASQPPRRFASLAEYLGSKPEHVAPHRPWFNHWTNALGFHDAEFDVPKPAGRFRVLGVGDSFTFGMVPYPQSVMALLEDRLRAACPGRDLDVLNAGIGGARVHEYRTLVELAAETYRPDLVLVNFYAGNDGPDLVRQEGERGSLRAWLRRSYLWTYARNLLRLRAAVSGAGDLAAARRGAPAPDAARRAPPRGGAVIDPGFRLRADDPALAGPVFEERAFTQIQAEELGRLYDPGDPSEVARAWAGTLQHLDAIRVHAARHGARLAVALYPSAVQVDAGLRAALVERLRPRPRYAGLAAAALDPALPGRVLGAYCRSRGVACFDLTPAFVRAARESPEPLYKFRDPHWTVRGNRVAAEAQARGLAPLVCPAPAAGPAG
jgi:hypothetical protein